MDKALIDLLAIDYAYAVGCKAMNGTALCAERRCWCREYAQRSIGRMAAAGYVLVPKDVTPEVERAFGFNAPPRYLPAGQYVRDLWRRITALADPSLRSPTP